MCGSYRVENRKPSVVIDTSATIMVMYRRSSAKGMVWDGPANGAGGEKYFSCAGEE